MHRFLAALLIATPVFAAAQTAGSPERFTAGAINPNTSGTGTIEIVVNRWSTDAERDKLLSQVLSSNQDKLLDVVQDMPRVGYIRTPDSIGWDLRFARKAPGEDGGERVVLMTDRRIGFWEARNRPRTIDYPFTFIELRLNKDGGGEGKMSLATRVIGDKENGIITLENYDIQPVMLTNIKREKISR